MATVNEIYALLDQKAPFRTQLGFDNAGFLVGHGEQTVTNVLVALDITPEVIGEAIERGVQLIVAHHPVIWDKLGRVTDESVTGRKILTLIEHGIAAICAHTNLDAAQGGVNDALAQAVGLIDPVPLEVDGTDENGLPYGIGRVGELSGRPMSVQAFAQRAKDGLRLGGIRAMDAGVPVQKVAVGGGACGSMLAEAQAMGCDTFLTADLKHDIYLEGQGPGHQPAGCRALLHGDGGLPCRRRVAGSRLSGASGHDFPAPGGGFPIFLRQKACQDRPLVLK